MATLLEIPELFQAALKSLQMYSITHVRTQSAIDELGHAIQQKLISQGGINLVAANGRLVFDGVTTEHRAGTEMFVKGMEERGIYSIAIHRGINPRELKELLLLLDENPGRVAELGGPEAFFQSRRHSSIRINETDIGFLVRHPSEGTRPGISPDGTIGLPVLPFDSPRSVITLDGQKSLITHRTENENEVSAPSLLNEHLREAMEEPFLQKNALNCRKLLDEMLEGNFTEHLQNAFAQLLQGLKLTDQAKKEKSIRNSYGLYLCG